MIEDEGRNRGCVSFDDLTERNFAKTDPAMFFRCIRRLSPISQREIGGHEIIPFNLDTALLAAQQKNIPPVSTPEIFDRIFKGGIPALLSCKYEDRNVFYSGYIST